MQISKQFLIDAVGLIITVALILTGVRIYQRAEQTAGILEDRQNRQLKAIEEYEITKYDGYSVDGTTALSYIKNMIESYGLSVTVTTAETTFHVTEKAQYANLRDMDSEQYINPLGKFRCEVIRDENMAVVGAELVYMEKGENQ